jgi:hypothetical protein
MLPPYIKCAARGIGCKSKAAKSGLRIINGRDFEREMEKKYGQDDLIRAQ